MLRRDFLMLTAAIVAGVAAGAPAVRAAETPGVTATEIKIGQTQSYSAPPRPTAPSARPSRPIST